MNFDKLRKSHLIALALVGVIGCSSGSGKDLGDEYMFVETNKDNHYIVKGHASIVDSNIIDYQVAENFILGARVKPKWSDVGEDLISKSRGQTP